MYVRTTEHHKHNSKSTNLVTILLILFTTHSWDLLAPYFNIVYNKARFGLSFIAASPSYLIVANNDVRELAAHFCKERRADESGTRFRQIIANLRLSPVWLCRDTIRFCIARERRERGTTDIEFTRPATQGSFPPSEERSL